LVLDFLEARKRLRGEELRPSPRSRMAEVLDLVEGWQKRLDSGEVNRADLAREAGLTRARVTQLLALIDLPPRERAALRGGDVDVSVNEALRRAGARRG
jgi:hypothetical protein